MLLDDHLIFPEWPAPARVRTLVTTRNGGVSLGPYASLNLGARVGDDSEFVKRNRARLRPHLPAEPKWLHQAHGKRVVDADSVFGPAEGDAAVARGKGSVCVILTADCLPVLLCDRKGTVVAAAHAGWRGLAAGVIEAAVAAMGTAPENILAYLGPAIGPAAYEVGAEVRTAFVSREPMMANAFSAGKPGKWLADLYALARIQLNRLQVRQIYGAGFCTYGEAHRFFSYRRDGETGRSAALIWLD